VEAALSYLQVLPEEDTVITVRLAGLRIGIENGTWDMEMPSKSANHLDHNDDDRIMNEDSFSSILGHALSPCAPI
jgi:hypothetical protein